MKIRSLLLLAASSIAFASSCACSHDKDQDFLNQINEVLVKNKDIITTCHDAVNVLKKNNVDIFSYIPTNLEHELVYDFDVKQFVVMQNDSIVFAPSEYKKNENTFSYFKFTSVYNGNANYSQYLLDDFPETENLIVTTGIDVGDHKDIKNLTYAGSVGVERNIKIRTYCDYLTIFADSDTVSYYGNANNIFVDSVKTFDIYGQNSYVQLRDGEITFKKNSITDFVEIPMKYKGAITVKQEKEATISCAINVENVEALPLKATEVATEAELVTALSKDSFIRLTSEIDSTGPITIASERSIIIDLNGYAINAYNDLTINGYLYLLDTEYSYNENCGIFLDESKIIVNGQLLMNGGNVFYFCEYGGYAAIEVSGAFNMYGGRIIVYDDFEYASAVCLWEGSLANIYYGTIFSDNAAFENFYGNLNIKAGNFTSSEKVCLMVGGKLDISGGTFTAKTCIDVDYGSDVDINISGGSFFNENTSVTDTENSVIYVCYSDLYKCSINIDNAYLYSRCSYIIKVEIDDEPTGEEVTINCNSGTYDYYLGDGVHIDEDIAEKVTIKKGGTWTNHPYA